jgi:hypothetical protein
VKLRRRDVIGALILVLVLGSLVAALVFGAMPR